MSRAVFAGIVVAETIEGHHHDIVLGLLGGRIRSMIYRDDRRDGLGGYMLNGAREREREKKHPRNKHGNRRGTQHGNRRASRWHGHGNSVPEPK